MPVLTIFDHVKGSAPEVSYGAVKKYIKEEVCLVRCLGECMQTQAS
jgi:hypothetical protein